MKLNGFNSVARMYDGLARLVFKNILFESQVYFLNQKPDPMLILVVGGGTGKVAYYILTQNPNAKIVFVDASSEMIRLAQARCLSFHHRIEFIHGTLNDVPQQKFDLIHAGFFVDMFTVAQVNRIMNQFNTMLKDTGLLILTDFIQSHNVFHRFLLWVMYRFFRVTTGIEAKNLPDWFNEMSKTFDVPKSKLFLSGLIKTCVAIRK